jgi:citrate lyase beta subunit
MRSILFAPGDNERRMDKALGLSADAVALDLEDGVAPSDRDRARELIAARLASRDTARDVSSRLFVRINRLSTLDGLRDLVALQDVLDHLDGLVLPMVEDPHEVRQLSRLLDELDVDLDILVGVETPLGLERLIDIIGASPKVTAVLFGGGDYAATVGTGLDFDALFYARSRLAAAAGQCRVPAYDVPYVDVRNTEGLRAESERVRALGFAGKAVIHPDQIEVVNRAFAPTAEEVAWARRVVEAASQAGKEGAFALDGRLVDRPIVLRCEQILTTADI